MGWDYQGSQRPRGLVASSFYLSHANSPCTAFVPKNVKVNKTPQNPNLSQPFGAPNVKSGPNPNLDSFETLMQAMDAELARSRAQPASAEKTKPDKGKGEAKATEEDYDNVDIEAAMEAELKDVLEKDVGEDDEADLGDEQRAEYNLIKNFLESFKSQGGLSGPVGALAGRLQPDWQLPKDAS